MGNVLDKIVAAKREEILAAKSLRSEDDLRNDLPNAPPLRDFFAALAAPGPIKLIAEIKKASPSKGVIREDFQPVEIARDYQAAGASCISILTDKPFFQGSLEILATVRKRCELPLLRKDFILDRYQLVEARMAGADAVLLIAECLDDCHLRMLFAEALALGMVPLVEFYEPENLSRVLELGATLIGVNNRNLRSFETNLEHTLRMRERIPDHCLVVGESGIHSREDVLRLEKNGVDAILVGEHLMLQPDVGAAVRTLLGK